MIADGSRVVTLSVDLCLRIVGYPSESSVSTRVIALKERSAGEGLGRWLSK